MGKKTMEGFASPRNCYSAPETRLSPVTCDQVGVVAALAELHHGVNEVRHVVLVRSFREEGEILLEDGSVVFLLNVCQLHLETQAAGKTS